ncbi:MAG: integrase [Planctomycetaceae bacterium]|nr:MAG: integrase [Planctomycetaceae bacterium]
MARFFHPLIAMLSSLTRNDLARQVRYLKEENRILRSKLPRVIPVTASERRRLIKFGTAVGVAIKHLIGIVSYRTFCRWVSQKKSHRKTGKRGRPRTTDDLRRIILRLAAENCWGYTRIVGELKKLGIRNVSRSTVINILKVNGFDPGPKRGEGTWDEFVKIHAKTLWACDFLQKRILTRFGMVDFFVLFFIHIGSRKVFVSGITDHPHAQWMTQQARNFSIHLHESGMEATHLIRDGDKKFVEQFNEFLSAGGTEIVRIPPAAPNMNPFAERWCQSLQTECLDHFIILGQRHLRYLVGEYLDYYNHCRPHQSMGNQPLAQAGDSPPPSTGRILCKERLGGLLKHYYRKTA